MAASSAHDGGPLVRRGAISTVASLFAGRARVAPGRVAAEDGGRRLTYGELDRRTQRLANVLAARGTFVAWSPLYHMGDVFVRNADGTLDFVDRVKYLIKTGGENVYPAEIERVMLQDTRVAEVAVVRRKDARWGEVPVAFVARRDPSLDEAELLALCRRELAGFKQPKAIHFIALDAFPAQRVGQGSAPRAGEAAGRLRANEERVR